MSEVTELEVIEIESLFVNRTDNFLIQLQKGGYSKIDSPLTKEVLERHLRGEITVASYQLDKDSHVKWLCFDLDPEHLENPQETARKILSVLFEKVKDKEGIERSRVRSHCVILEASRFPDPSYHIWVLFFLPVLAKVAKWLGLRILELAGVSPKQVEVFPKQEEVTSERAFGNCVKLPFGFHQVERKWSRMLDFDSFEPLPFEDLENKYGLTFSSEDMKTLEGMETKRHVQASFEMPKAFKKLNDREEEEYVQFIMRYWREGYRNEMTMYLCGYWIKKGVSQESARRIIEEVCRRTDTSREDTSEFLASVDYQYSSRRNIGSLKGSSGIRELIKELKKHERERA